MRFEFEDYWAWCPEPVVVELRFKTPLLLFGAAAEFALLLAPLDAAVFDPAVSGGREPMKLLMMLKLLLITFPLAWIF